MDYVQMTLDDWVSLKKEIAEEFARASASFVRIGYLLRKAEDSQGYRNEGYDTLTEWAQAELGITATYVSRFKAINAKYSVDGYSDRLKTEFVGYGSAKLGEMLALPDGDMEMIRPETKRQDIRSLKEFNKEAPEAEDPEAWALEMMTVLPDGAVADLKKAVALGSLSARSCREILNPSGNKMLRTKTAMIAMTDESLIVKTFGPAGGRRTVEWSELAEWIATKAPFPDASEPEEIMPEPEETAPKPEETDTKPQETEPAAEEDAGEESDAEKAEAEAEEESWEEPEEPKASPAEAEEPIAPAQKQRPPQAERDLATMMSGLQKAVKARNWDTALSFAEGIEAALRKIRNS